MKRLAVVGYAVNGSGLGHLTRTLAVMRWMKRLARLCGVALDGYILTTSEAPGVAVSEGFAAFKIPSKTAVKAAGIPKEDYLRLARQWIWHSIGLLKPDILLVDTFPGGSFGELSQALDAARKRVFIHRSMKAEMAESEAVKALLPLYDRILVPVEPGSESRPLDDCLAAKTRYIGPVMLRSREELRPRNEARARLGVPDGRRAVWLSAGGGGDPKAGYGIRAMVDMLGTISDLHLVIGAGPLYRGDPINGPGITWVTGFPAMEDFLGIDFAVAAAGFNSFYELLHAGVPSAFFAQEKIADEQARRVCAARLAGAAVAVESVSGVPEPGSLMNGVAQLANPLFCAALSERARSFVSCNDARQAAFEALSTVIAAPQLEEALETGSTEFFVELDSRRISVEETFGILKLLKSYGLSPDDRAAAVLQIVSETAVESSIALRLFGAFARRSAPPVDDDEMDTMVAGALSVISAFARFGDMNGAVEFIKALPFEPASEPAALAAAVERFAGLLLKENDSLWRGVALVSQELGRMHGASATEVLLSAEQYLRTCESDLNVVAGVLGQS